MRRWAVSRFWAGAAMATSTRMIMHGKTRRLGFLGTICRIGMALIISPSRARVESAVYRGSNSLRLVHSELVSGNRQTAELAEQLCVPLYLEDSPDKRPMAACSILLPERASSNMKRNLLFSSLIPFLFLAAIAAQSGPAVSPVGGQGQPVSYASVTQLNGLLSQLEATSKDTQ